MVLDAEKQRLLFGSVEKIHFDVSKQTPTIFNISRQNKSHLKEINSSLRLWGVFYLDLYLNYAKEQIKPTYNFS